MTKSSKKEEASQKEHVRNKGAHCPSCGSDQLDGDHVEINGGIATQLVRCGECDMDWTDKYVLVGFENLK